MKRILPALLLLTHSAVFSQFFTSGQQAVINAENSFAGMSKSQNTVDAFRAYLSDKTIMFNGSNQPVTGKSLWNDRKADKTLLFWWPVFVGVSADGSMGFSTGPWEWSKSRDTLPQAFGYYATLWEKDKEGNWKMGVDLGVSMSATDRVNPALAASPTSPKKFTPDPSAKKSFLDYDKSYNSQLKTASYNADQFTSDAHMLRNNNKPFANPLEFATLNESGKSYLFEQAGGDIASSQDLAYAYGTVYTSAAKEKADAKYFRVWKRDENGWKIVLDVLSTQ